MDAIAWVPGTQQMITDEDQLESLIEDVRNCKSVGHVVTVAGMVRKPEFDSEDIGQSEVQ